MTTSQPTPDAPVVLTEYDNTLVRLSAEQALELRRLARGAVTVQLDEVPGTWRITSSHYVGTIATSGTRILITPKLDTGSLFYLLEASGRPVSTGPADFHYDVMPDLVPSFATFTHATSKERSPAASPAPTRISRSGCRQYAVAWTSRRNSASLACLFPPKPLRRVHRDGPKESGAAGRRRRHRRPSRGPPGRRRD